MVIAIDPIVEFVDEGVGCVVELAMDEGLIAVVDGVLIEPMLEIWDDVILSLVIGADVPGV